MKARKLKQVNKAIQREVGNYTLVKGEGYFYVTSEDQDKDLKLSSLFTTSIFCCSLNHQSVEEWVNDVKDIISGCGSKP